MTAYVGIGGEPEPMAAKEKDKESTPGKKDKDKKKEKDHKDHKDHKEEKGEKKKEKDNKDKEKAKSAEPAIVIAKTGSALLPRSLPLCLFCN